MKAKGTRIALAVAAALALGTSVLLTGCGEGNGNPKSTPTPTTAALADPTAQAAVTDIDSILQSTKNGLDQEAIPTGIDAPDPTGATVDASALLTEAASMTNELSTPVPTLGS